VYSKSTFVTTDAFGTKRWINKRGEIHRIDGPAVIFKDGYKEWRINGNLHREDGPAVVFPDGNKQWWINRIRYETKDSYFEHLSDKSKEKCLFSEDFLNG
jgi:hypothetical protein